MHGSVNLAAVCLLTACAPPYYLKAVSDRLTISAGPKLGYGIKRVIDKLPPATVVGDDGSVCRTSTERFRTTELQSWLACTWTFPALDAGEASQPQV